MAAWKWKKKKRIKQILLAWCISAWVVVAQPFLYCICARSSLLRLLLLLLLPVDTKMKWNVSTTKRGEQSGTHRAKNKNEKGFCCGCCWYESINETSTIRLLCICWCCCCCCCCCSCKAVRQAKSAAASCVTSLRFLQFSFSLSSFLCCKATQKDGINKISSCCVIVCSTFLSFYCVVQLPIRHHILLQSSAQSFSKNDKRFCVSLCIKNRLTSNNVGEEFIRINKKLKRKTTDSSRLKRDEKWLQSIAIVYFVQWGFCYLVYCSSDELRYAR